MPILRLFGLGYMLESSPSLPVGHPKYGGFSTKDMPLVPIITLPSMASQERGYISQHCHRTTKKDPALGRTEGLGPILNCISQAKQQSRQLLISDSCLCCYSHPTFFLKSSTYFSSSRLCQSRSFHFRT